MESRVIVQDIFIYPIKSLGGIRLTEASVEEKGFQYDRRWMLVDENGIFITQRKYPRMALLSVELGEMELAVFNKLEPESKVKIPLNCASGPERSVTIWDDQVLAKSVNRDLDQWFSDFMGFSVSLVMMPDSTQRKVSEKYAVHGESVSFADGMPYLMIGQRSLDDLNSRLEIPVPMNRFRPNIVFSGGSAYLEDSLRKIKIGQLEFQIVKPCARCVLTTVDQESGVKGKEPLKTLASYRTVNSKIYFGQNVVALQAGKISVEDEIVPLD